MPIEINASTSLDAYDDTPTPLEAPPEQFFDTRDQMLVSVRQYALSRGYTTTTGSSTGDRQVIYWR